MAKTGLTYEALETAFRHGNFKPLYFLYGEERFLIDELQALLIEHALEPHERDFNFDLVYGADTETPAVLALCAGYPMMAQRRVVVVRDFDKLKGNRSFAAYAEQPNPHAVVLLIASGKPNLSAHPYRALRQHAAHAQFKPLYANKMPGWISQRVASRGRRIDPQAAALLADIVGPNLRAAATEIEKLITFAGERKTITPDDVVQAGGQTRDVNVFELQRAVGQGRLGDAVRIGEGLLQQASNTRGEALMIVSLLTAYLTKLWKLSSPGAARMTDAQLAGRIGVSPYFVKEYTFAARHFGPRRLEQAFSALLAADFELKGGSTRDERLILALLMRRLIPQARAAA